MGLIARALSTVLVLTPVIAQEESGADQQPLVEFGELLMRETWGGRRNNLSDWIDDEAVVRRSLAGLSKAEVETLGIKASLACVALTAPDGNLDRLESELVGMEFRRVVEVRGEPALLFRVRRHDRGGGYYGLVCGRDEPLRVVDVFSFQTGEFMSDGLRQSFRRSLDHYTEPEEAFLAHVEHQRFAKASEAYAALPEARRRSREFLVSRVQVVTALQDAEAYAVLVDDLRRYLPEDDLLRCTHSFAGYFLRSDAKAAAELEPLRQSVGPDGWVRSIQASSMQRAGQTEAAIAYLQLAVSEEPEFYDAHERLIWELMVKGDHVMTLQALKRFVGQFEKVDLRRVTEVRGSAEFLASPEGEQWTAWLVEAKPEASAEEGGAETGVGD